MAISKKIRQLVHSKYDGHCAYCGKEIAYTEMQVDHMHPQRMRKRLSVAGKIDVDAFENLMPTCRRCNHYKRAGNLRQFRIKMKTLHERLAKIYIFNVGVDFGITTLQPFDGKFYFEKVASNPLSPKGELRS